MKITALTATSLVVIKFRIRRLARFLSHAETVSVFQRACIRAGINLRYSRGFNPRPRLSLPLPRPVGIESDDDLLCIWVNRQPSLQNDRDFCDFLRAALCLQMPEGIELLDISLAESAKALQPTVATYQFDIKAELATEDLHNRINNLLESPCVFIQRERFKSKNKNAKPKDLNVRQYLDLIELAGPTLKVDCKITAGGTIRINEIMNLLGLDYKMLASPLRRTSINWQSD